MSYATPTVTDYGDIVDLTAAVGLEGAEDGTMKNCTFIGQQQICGSVPG